MWYITFYFFRKQTCLIFDGELLPLYDDFFWWSYFRNGANGIPKHQDKKERLLIQLRYFDGYTQQEVAQRLFISQVQVSRLEKKILEKLKINI